MVIYNGIVKHRLENTRQYNLVKSFNKGIPIVKFTEFSDHKLINIIDNLFIDLFSTILALYLPLFTKSEGSKDFFLLLRVKILRVGFLLLGVKVLKVYFLLLKPEILEICFLLVKVVLRICLLLSKLKVPSICFLLSEIEVLRIYIPLY